MAGQVVPQHLFGLGLGDEQQEGIGGVVQAEPEQPDADDAAGGVELDPDRVVAPRDQLLGQPQAAEDLRVRGWTPNARDSCTRSSCRSTMRTVAPNARSWAARVRPVGPAPTTRTSSRSSAGVT